MSYFRYSSKEITLEEATKAFQKVNDQIQDLIYKLGDECDNLRSKPEDLDHEFMRDQYRSLADKLDDIYRRIEYLSKPIVAQGYIRHNESKRYELPDGTYFTSGSSCEILFNDKEYGEQYWVKTTIEHNGDDYYSTALGRDVNINEMMVRVRER